MRSAGTTRVSTVLSNRSPSVKCSTVSLSGRASIEDLTAQDNGVQYPSAVVSALQQVIPARGNSV